MQAWPSADAPEPDATAGGPALDVLSEMVDEAASQAARALILRPRPDIVVDGELRSIQTRAVAYLRAGVPVHFRGPAGTGKTTLALHVAAHLGRPVSVVTGDSWMTSADLLGREVGQNSTQVRDRYVQRVLKTTTATRVAWSDSVLTQAMIDGHTLVYDEFTRAPAEANNALLSALEERILILSNPARRERYVRAHPEFRAILTSNPDEYAGVSASPDALFDRMVTFEIGWGDRAAEAGIVARRTGLGPQDADVIVGVVRELRAADPASHALTLRAAIMIGRIVAALGLSASAGDERFLQVCVDVLETRASADADPAARARAGAALRARILAACRAAGAARLAGAAA